jgi:hypothetical protein
VPISQTRPVRFALRAWFAFRMLRTRDRPHPVDVPAVRSGNPKADRVLLVGNGPSHGWGVLTHGLALTGQLATAITERTGRPVDIDLVGAEAMNVRSTVAWIGDRDLDGDDLVVLAVGFNDALRLTPLPIWRSELTRLLDELENGLRADAAIAVAGIPPIRSFSPYGSLAGRASEHHRERLNGVTRQIVTRRRIRYIDLPAASGSPDDPDGAVYAEFAERIADRVAPLVIASRPRPTRRAERRRRDWDWSGTPAIVDAALRGGEPQLRLLAEQAQKQFGVEVAVVSLVDGDRLYHGTNTDLFPASVPLELSFCKYTVEAGEPVVIPDTGKDERFIGNPLVDVSFINFYAGYPLRASDGQVIGSFCLQGSRPRTPSKDALAELERMALQAQDVLRGYEVAPVAVGAGTAGA